MAPASGDTWRVRLAVGNAGYLPAYVTHRARERQVARGTVFEITLPAGATLVTGKEREIGSHLEGHAPRSSLQAFLPDRDVTADRTLQEWIVRGPKGSRRHRGRARGPRGRRERDDHARLKSEVRRQWGHGEDAGPATIQERSTAMWSLIGLVVVVLLLTVVPVMIAARVVGARRTGFWRQPAGAVRVLALIVGVAVRRVPRRGRARGLRLGAGLHADPRHDLPARAGGGVPAVHLIAGVIVARPHVHGRRLDVPHEGHDPPDPARHGAEPVGLKAAQPTVAAARYSPG
jgi:hypothetical protein